MRSKGWVIGGGGGGRQNGTSSSRGESSTPSSVQGRGGGGNSGRFKEWILDESVMGGWYGGGQSWDTIDRGLPTHSFFNDTVSAENSADSGCSRWSGLCTGALSSFFTMVPGSSGVACDSKELEVEWVCFERGEDEVMIGMCFSLLCLWVVVSSVWSLVEVCLLCADGGKGTHSVLITGSRIIGRSSPRGIFGNSSPLATSQTQKRELL